MSSYKVPCRDILFATQHLADLPSITALPDHQEATIDLLEAILTEAGKIAEQVLAPINQQGDRQGVTLKNGEVTTADGFQHAYTLFIQGGWNGLPFDPDRGGQGLPWIIATAVQEIWHSANMAFSLCPLLTQAAIEAIELHGSEAQKQTYLGNLIHGNWSGTMNLTEPHCGSDLGAITTSAKSNGDHYLIQGQKIFVTYGDHDMTDNIIHLVLARLPDAPAGVKGISLFIVPKLLADEQGEWCVRNDVETISLEHKLGINASPTAVLGYGTGKYPSGKSAGKSAQKGAVGYLIGQENQGMTYMFTMMNIARLSVGLEANGVAERAYQQASAYAHERIQGTAIDAPGEGRVAIINHPDIKRMLMLQKCRIESLRALGLTLGGALDKSRKHTAAKARKVNQAMVDILTPIVKATMSDQGIDNVSLALQIHGGAGFIEETGAAQYYRDQRITSIYEGTNGIQALDLMARKTLRDGGEIAHTVIDYMRADMKNLQQQIGRQVQPNQLTQNQCQDMFDSVLRSLDILQNCIAEIIKMAAQDSKQAAAISDPYLRLWGVVCCGWMSAKAAKAAMILDDGSDRFYADKVTTAQFYFQHEMPLVDYYQAVILKCAEPIARLDNDIFAVR